MITYVINTSENRIFESECLSEDILFELSGYKKTRWMNCRLNEIDACAKEIFEKQGRLGAEKFRVAVIVDFLNFDRIRVPYGQNGYGVEETGVEFSLYLPYVEAYITDHLIHYLEKNEVAPETSEVYYIQYSDYDESYFLDNGKDQLKFILAGKKGTEEPASEEKLRNALWNAMEQKYSEILSAGGETDAAYDEGTFSDTAEQPAMKEKHDSFNKVKDDPHIWVDEAEYSAVEEANTPYRSFELYCTKTVTLEFRISEYPYGAGAALTFDDFFNGFRLRVGYRSGILRHHFNVSYARSPFQTAFETLSLSLYLIKLYEREEETDNRENVAIGKLSQDKLKKMLEKSWNKICAAERSARENHAIYYSLNQDVSADGEKKDPEKETAQSFYSSLRLSDEENKATVEEQYKKINDFAAHRQNGINGEDRSEFNGIIASYLRKRDDTKEETIEREFDELNSSGFLKMTDQYPSRAAYDFVVGKKEKEISDLMDDALKAEYIEVDFSEEKERADKTYKKYLEAKACLEYSIIGDIVFFLISMVGMIVPYRYLQGLAFASGALIKYLTALGVFGGLFIFALLWQILLINRRIKKAKTEMLVCYSRCVAKHRFAFSELRKRYEKELVSIEEKRYELKQLANLYGKNKAINKNANCHRERLLEIEERLSGMLSNLGVEPKINFEERVDGEFDLTKDIGDPANSIYRILSLEVIEELFSERRI